jgi:hypothetical protein
VATDLADWRLRRKGLAVQHLLIAWMGHPDRESRRWVEGRDLQMPTGRHEARLIEAGTARAKTLQAQSA